MAQIYNQKFIIQENETGDCLTLTRKEIIKLLNLSSKKKYGYEEIINKINKSGKYLFWALADVYMDE